MTRLEHRQTLANDIKQACAAGARLAPACALAGIDARTLQRWQAGDGAVRADRRPDANRPTPSHALSEAERARIIAAANDRASQARHWSLSSRSTRRVRPQKRKRSASNRGMDTT